jgi:hypothetical protein
MAAAPVFTATPNVGAFNAVLSTAMTNTKAFDGTEAVGTPMALIFTAGADGSRIDQIICRLSSTNGATASGTSAATLVRFWINNSAANTTATNNQFLGEVAIPATAVTALGTTALTTFPLTIPSVGLNIPGTYKIYAGTTVAAGGTNIGIAVSAFGGNY